MKQTYLHPPKKKIINSRPYYRAGSDTGYNKQDAISRAKLLNSIEGSMYRFKVVRFKAPEWVYLEGYVYWIYYTPKN